MPGSGGPSLSLEAEADAPDGDEVAGIFGVKRSVSFLKVKRSTFVIDTDRTVLDVIHSEVSMGAHADKALALLKARRAA